MLNKTLNRFATLTSQAPTTQPSNKGMVMQYDGANNIWGSGPNDYRNKLINGDMKIWQRGTSSVLTTTAAYASADRWAAFQTTAAAGTISQSTDVPINFKYSLRIGRNNASAANPYQVRQVIESFDCIPLQNKTCVVSFWAKNGINITGSTNLVVYTGTGTNEGYTTLGSWTGNNIVLNQTLSLNTTWTRYQYTFTVSSNVNEIGIQFINTPTGTASGTEDCFYITGVQLEEGTVASPFEYRQYGVELQLCQRHLYLVPTGWQYSGMAITTTTGYAAIPFKVSMRIAPTTISISSQTLSNVYSAAGVSTATTAVAFSSATTDSCLISWTVASGMVAGNATFFTPGTATFFISVEL